MHWFYIPAVFLCICSYKAVHFKAMIYNQKHGTKWGVTDYMSKRIDLGLMFPILHRSMNDERNQLIKKYNRAVAGFWVGFITALGVGFLEFVLS